MRESEQREREKSKVKLIEQLRREGMCVIRLRCEEKEICVLYHK